MSPLIKDLVHTQRATHVWELVPLRWAASYDRIRAKSLALHLQRVHGLLTPLSVIATYPGWVSTGTRFPTAPEWHPVRNSSLTKEQQTFGITRFWCVSNIQAIYIAQIKQPISLSLCVPDYFSSPARSCANKSQPLIDSTTAVILGPLQ